MLELPVSRLFLAAELLYSFRAMGGTSAKQVTDLTLNFELLQTKLDWLEAGRKPDELDAWRIGAAFSIKLQRPYTVARVCRVWGFSRSTVLRRLKTSEMAARRLIVADEQIADQLRELIRETPFPAERHRKLWARLCRKGVQVSRERVRRIVKEFSLLPPDLGGLIKNAPNQMWAIDSAKVRTAFDGEVRVLFAVEHCTFECLAADVVQEETFAAWRNLLIAAVAYGRPLFPVEVRMDNLPLFREKAFGQMLAEIGLRASRIPILRPQSNGIGERFVRILRENLLSIQSFDYKRDLAVAVRDFRGLFNHQYLVARFDYQKPDERRRQSQALKGFSI